MSDEHIAELKDTLSRLLLGHEYHSDNHSPENGLIRRLAGMIHEHDDGNISTPGLVNYFARDPVPGFDLLEWLEQMVSEGIYSDDLLDELAKGSAPA